MHHQALILAAGRGSRLRQMTDDRPKAMVELAGRPLLHWQLGAFRTAGINDVTVVGGYRADRLQGDFTLIRNPDWDKGNMVLSLMSAGSVLEQGPTVVSYADILYPADHVRTVVAAPHDIALAYDTDWLTLWRLRAEDPLEDAEPFIAENGFVTRIGGRARSLEEIKGQYMGLMKISPTGWSTIQSHLESLSNEARARLDMTALFAQLLAKGIKIGALPIRGRWVELDSCEDHAVYANCLTDGSTWSHDWR